MSIPDLTPEDHGTPSTGNITVGAAGVPTPAESHDLLALAKECESKLIGLAVIHAAAPQLGKICDELTLTLSKIYASLRPAHEELCTAREAYTNIDTERDNLQLECDRLTEHNRVVNEQLASIQASIDTDALFTRLNTAAKLTDECDRLRGELKAARQYNHLLATGHDFQCNARDGFECDCGQFETSESRRIQYMQDTLKVTAADSIANTVELSMVIKFWPGVTIGQNVVLRGVIDKMLEDLDHEA